jgi:hypothetical protein
MNERRKNMTRVNDAGEFISWLHDFLEHTIREEEGEEVLDELKEISNIACEITNALALRTFSAPKPISLDRVVRYNELVKKHYQGERDATETDKPD